MVRKAADREPVGLTNRYIHRVMRDKLGMSCFAGVYSADGVPDSLLSATEGKSCCVVNLSRRKEPGTHFVALLIDPKNIVVGDSLALPLQQCSPHLQQRLASAGRRGRKRVRHLFSRPLQAPWSAFCGIYAMLFCLQSCKEEFPRTGGTKKFVGDAKANDAIAKENFVRLVENNKNVY